VAGTPAFEATFAALRELASGVGSPADLAAGLGALAKVAPPAHIALTDLPDGVSAVLGGPQLAGFIGSLLNTGTGAARFEIVLADAPYSLAAMDTVDALKDVFNTLPEQGAVSGPTAVNADIRDYLRTDQRRTITLVLAGIAVILMIMLRSIVAPVT
jgi:RND superfamily putative drug exporter